MSDLRDLYQELIIDHGRRPRNFSVLENATCMKEGYNPLCGDKITVYVRDHDRVIEDITFQGEGCAISMASASLMTEMLKGKTEQQALELFSYFHQLVTGAEDRAFLQEKLSKLIVLGGVSEFPARVKCATLAWHTMHAALQQDDKPVSTE